MAFSRPEKYLWLDGEITPWEAGCVHLLTHTLHYGLGAFEGIRCYKQPDGRGAVFRLADHVNRLFGSCHICTIAVPYSRAQVEAACIEVLRRNGLCEAYLRPICFLGDESMGLGALEPRVRLAVVSYVWGTYLGEEGLQKGIRAKVSSFTRGGLNASMSKGKICGQYVNSVLAKREVMAAGYDEAILLDSFGQVAEASGENIFLVSDGRILTPPQSSAILAGITRDTVIRLAAELRLPVHETTMSRDQLYLADEVFLTGTAAEITPVREIDDRIIGSGKPGPITRRMQSAFFELVRGGGASRHPGWFAVV